MSIKKALLWTAFWIGLALCFNVGIYFFMGKEKALEFLGGFIIEKSLSIDNLFLFVIVFASFGIIPVYQRKILNYGILGALILRLIFVLLGVSIVTLFHWVLYIFGAILIFSGVKILVNQDKQVNYKDSRIIKLLGKIIPFSDKLESNKFFINENNILYATPLFAVLILIEFTDVIFAIDSIPAIFSITTDPFIVYTSNLFAILGLRSIYFVLAKLHEKFIYVKYGVSIILIFTGVKLSVLFFDLHIPIEWSLVIIFTILFGSIVLSFASVKKMPIESISETEAPNPSQIDYIN